MQQVTELWQLPTAKLASWLTSNLDDEVVTFGRVGHNHSVQPVLRRDQIGMRRSRPVAHDHWIAHRSMKHRKIIGSGAAQDNPASLNPIATRGRI